MITVPYRLWSALDMLRFHASKFVSLMHGLSVIENSAYEGVGVQLPPDYEKTILDMQNQMHRLGLHVSAGVADDLLNCLEEEKIDFRKLNIAAACLRSAFTNELETQVFMAVAYDRVDFLFEKQLFEKEVATKFTSVAYDVAEAGNCYSLDRNTACVFHLMRVLEMAIKAIATCLGIPDPVKPSKKNWSAVLERINDELTKRNAPNGPGWTNQKDKQLFADAYARLDAIRIAWRNTTMHTEETYQADEAKTILENTKQFMIKLASRMDQDGLPLA